jgi:hypothetical protein
MKLRVDDPLAVALITAIRLGDMGAVRTLVGENPGLAAARIEDLKGARRRR